MEELEGEERGRVMRMEKVIRLRMNPEPKKDGRKKMRLLVRGDTEPREWNEGKCLDSPTLMASSVKMMVAASEQRVGVSPGGGTVVEPTELSVGDISGAFVSSPRYGPDERSRYVAYREYPGGPLRVFKLLGSLYKQQNTPYQFYKTLKN